jgi:hypothetical protein
MNNTPLYNRITVQAWGVDFSDLSAPVARQRYLLIWTNTRSGTQFQYPIDCIPSLIFRSQSPSIPTSRAAESSPSAQNACNARYVGGEAQCIFPLGRFSTNACDRINLYRAVHRYVGSLARSGMCCLRYQLLNSSSERAAEVNDSRRRWFPCLGPLGAGLVGG